MGMVSESHKVDLYSRALAVYNGVFAEDFGYITIESFLAEKPVLIHTDSGGPLEFVISGTNGFVCQPNSMSIAHFVNKLVDIPRNAVEMGKCGLETVREKNITWEHVIERLLL